MVLTAASTDRILGGWGVPGYDPNDQYGQDGKVVTNRGEWSYDNDAIAHAIVESILQGTLGPTGLTARSTFQADDSPEVSEDELRIRRAIERGIARGTRARLFDASGVLTRPEMSKVTLAATVMSGIALSVRAWRPLRPGRPSHGTCWRIPHSSRLSNPNYGPNTDRLRDGFELDEDGSPIAVHIQRSHPDSSLVAPKLIWQRVPMFDELGYPMVTIHALHRHADQLRPTGWFTPVMQLMRLFGRTIEAKVVADVLKASMGLIVETDNPEQAAAADANGVVLNGNTKISPGKCYYVKKGTIWKTLDFRYDGQDFDKWQEVVLTNICAAFGMPYQFVQMKLTNSNMASSRVALLQAYRTFHGYQQDLITSTEDPWNQSLIREDLLRGRLDLKGPVDEEVVERLLSCRYLRPARFMPDPSREAQAAVTLTQQLGVSYDTALGDMSLDFDDEAAARERNDDTLEQRGIELVRPGDTTPPDAPAPADEPTAPADERVAKTDEPKGPNEA